MLSAGYWDGRYQQVSQVDSLGYGWLLCHM